MTKLNNDNSSNKARITSVHKDLFGFSCQKDSGYARIKRGNYPKGAKNFPTVGDWVILDYQKLDHSLILKTLPRKSVFARLDSASNGNKNQLVAANFDYVFIMQSLDRDFNLRRLERYLALAWQSGGSPVVLLTKADVAEDYAHQIAAAQRIAIGTSVHAISALTGEGIDCLSQYLQPGKTVVLLGSSGVGKSTLLNHLAGEERMDTYEVRERDHRGRHTTSHRQLIDLTNGATIIDTPGMREVGLWESAEGLSKSFSDVEGYFGQCKFNDCQHQSEPGCAIKEAIRIGELSPERWESYLKLLVESRFTQDKDGYLKEKEQRLKQLSQLVKQSKKSDYRVEACGHSFICETCGKTAVPETAGSRHRNHCPYCLNSKHIDTRPGDRASLCQGIMEPVSIWSKDDGEWAIIHRCQSCGVLKSNRVAADDNQQLLIRLAYQAIKRSPFPIKN